MPRRKKAQSRISKAESLVSENPLGGPYQFEGFPEGDAQAVASRTMFGDAPGILSGKWVGVGRSGSNAHGTWGGLSIWDGSQWVLKGYTLEPRPNAGKGPIPIGKYTFTRWMSPKLGKTLRLYNVPGFTDVLVHVGNTQGDTVGCILAAYRVDNRSNPTRLIDSRPCVDWLYDTQDAGTIWVAS